MSEKKECECFNWCRTDPPGHPLTNHHPNCSRVDDSLFKVYRVTVDRAWYVTDSKPDEDPELVTEEMMHEEVYEALPEFAGF